MKKIISSVLGCLLVILIDRNEGMFLRYIQDDKDESFKNGPAPQPVTE